mgnify:CR=1 FL=1
MNYLTFILQANAAAGQPNQWSFWLMIALIFVIMWLFMIRPQQKKQKEMQQLRDALKKGDKVVTIGGIYGTVVDVKENTVLLEISDSVKIKCDKASLVKDFSDTQQ